MMSAQTKCNQNISVNSFLVKKQSGEKFACLTVYDYCSAYAASEQGVEILLVGDSLGMVIQGHDNSLPVTIDDMAYHMRCVRAGNKHALLMADLPFMSYYSELESMKNAAVLMREGAHIVKLEGGAWLAETTRRLVKHGIPVCAHIGLTPQSINHLGGYRVQGRDPGKGRLIIEEAKALQQAGASMILIECVPRELGKLLAQSVSIPVIGIGAGVDTDGQILVWHDLLGLYPGKKAKFVKNFLQGNPNGVNSAIADYVQQVRSGQFPGEQHSYN